MKRSYKGGQPRYRGPDRRSARQAPRVSLPIPSVVIGFGAAALLLLIWARTSSAQLGEATDEAGRLEVAAGALAILAASASAIRSRIDGHAPAWWIGIAIGAFGIPAIAMTPGSEMFAPVHVAAVSVALGCFVLALRSPEVDTGLSPVRSLLGWCLLFGLFVAVSRAALEAGSPEKIASLVLAFGYIAVSVDALRRSTTRHDANAAKVFVLTFGLGLAELVGGAVNPGHPAHFDGPALLRLMAMSIAAFAVVGELYAANASQRRATYESHLRRTDAEQHRRQIEERFAETLHEVRSTVLALEGGVRHLDRASSAEQSLGSALLDEIDRLRALVSEEAARAADTSYRVREALEPMLTVSMAGGWPVRWKIADALEASGRPAELAQVVHGLLTNAMQHAAGPVDVTARRDGEYILVVVDDRGPGVDRPLREAIFERGERADMRVEGSGLGLYIARSLMRRENGDVWVESRPGGGARFVVAVPAADPGATPIGEHRALANHQS